MSQTQPAQPSARDIEFSQTAMQLGDAVFRLDALEKHYAGAHDELTVRVATLKEKMAELNKQALADQQAKPAEVPAPLEEEVE